MMNRCRLLNRCVAAIILLNVGQTQGQESDIADVVAPRDVVYYSEHVACFGRIHFPAEFSTDGRTPGVILAGGWTATADSLAPYAREIAAAGRGHSDPLVRHRLPMVAPARPDRSPAIALARP